MDIGGSRGIKRIAAAKNMKFNFTNQEKDFEVEILDQGTEIKIIVNGQEFTYGEKILVEATVPQTAIPKRELGTKEVRAVLAGTITEINIKPGDIVKAGQKMMTLSAMKMENEILAETEGKVKEVNINKNQRVKEGDILVRLV